VRGGRLRARPGANGVERGDRIQVYDLGENRRTEGKVVAGHHQTPAWSPPSSRLLHHHQLPRPHPVLVVSHSLRVQRLRPYLCCCIDDHGSGGRWWGALDGVGGELWRACNRHGDRAKIEEGTGKKGAENGAPIGV
jgi:hypothetical protein